MIIWLRPIRMPGMMPPRNILPVEMEQMPAMTTIGMEGGIMMPTVEDTPVTVTVSSLE